jgi:hypothetical protein
MKKKTTSRCLFLAAFLFASSLGRAQTSIISQIVDGSSWLTAIAVTNTSASVANASLSFFEELAGSNSGATLPWTLAFVEMTSTQAQNLVLQPGTTIFLHTLGTAPTLNVGWGQLQEPDNAGSVVAYAIFTQRVAGRTDQDGTSPAAPAASRILVPFDNSNGAVTTMAVASPAQNVSISVGIHTPVSTTQATPITLSPQGHASFTFPTQFPVTAGTTGLAEFSSASGSFSILALRFQNGAFTTAPVYSVNGPPAIATNSRGGSGAGNILMALFSLGKINPDSQIRNIIVGGQSR